MDDAENFEIQNLEYSLAKQVPAMERGFVVETNYGPISIDSEDAAPIVAAVRRVLVKQLAAAKKQHGVRLSVIQGGKS